MQVIILIGPHAVGKMTIGQALEGLSDYKLFHNHIAIEMAAPYFSYSTPEGRRLVGRLRQVFFDAFLESDQPGFIFTFVWAFGEPGEQEYIEGITRQFEQRGHTVHWVELEADLDERIRRNRTENRLIHKPSKRDLAWSEANLKRAHEEHRLNSLPGEITHPRYQRIDCTALSAEAVAARIWAQVS